MTVTLLPWPPPLWASDFARASVSVLLPTPDGPVMAMRGAGILAASARPACQTDFTFCLADEPIGARPIARPLSLARLSRFRQMAVAVPPGVHSSSFFIILTRHAGRRCGQADTARALLETNADPRVTDGDGGTPLHDASAGGHLNIVKMLVERIRERDEDDVSSFVNARDGDGETPLHLATRGEHGPVVTFLISHGARVEIKSDAGLVAREYAAEGGALDETLRAAEASKAPRTP